MEALTKRQRGEKVRKDGKHQGAGKPEGLLPLEISEVKIRLIDDPPGSLLGWASCVVNGSLFLNNIGIRRSREGNIFLAFPNLMSKSDKRYFFFNPVNREAMRVFEKAILARMPGNGS